jgi:hypothetical protein
MGDTTAQPPQTAASSQYQRLAVKMEKPPQTAAGNRRNSGLFRRGDRRLCDAAVWSEGEPPQNRRRLTGVV